MTEGTKINGMAEVRSSWKYFDFFLFLKAGEEWTTIAKTKGKKKTKPEDEWQEVGHVVHTMNWIYLCRSFNCDSRWVVQKRTAGERSLPQLQHLINSKRLLSKAKVREVVGDEAEGMVVEAVEIGVEEEGVIKEVVALFPGKTPEEVDDHHLEEDLEAEDI